MSGIGDEETRLRVGESPDNIWWNQLTQQTRKQKQTAAIALEIKDSVGYAERVVSNSSRDLLFATVRIENPIDLFRYLQVNRIHFLPSEANQGLRTAASSVFQYELPDEKHRKESRSELPSTVFIEKFGEGSLYRLIKAKASDLELVETEYGQIAKGSEMEDMELASLRILNEALQPTKEISGVSSITAIRGGQYFSLNFDSVTGDLRSLHLADFVGREPPFGKEVFTNNGLGIGGPANEASMQELLAGKRITANGFTGFLDPNTGLAVITMDSGDRTSIVESPIRLDASLAHRGLFTPSCLQDPFREPQDGDLFMETSLLTQYKVKFDPLSRDMRQNLGGKLPPSR